MKTLNTRTFVKTGLSLLGLAVGIAAPIQNIRPAFAQTDKMAPAPKMADSKMAHADKMGGMTVGTGSFRQITHATKGTATLSVDGSKRVVKLANFETGMGPKLHVYLVPGAVQSNAGVKTLVAAKKFVDLGTLKSIKGNQTYAVPSSSKLGKGASIVVWCDKFDVVFGAATLS